MSHQVTGTDVTARSTAVIPAATTRLPRGCIRAAAGVLRLDEFGCASYNEAKERWGAHA